MFAHFNIQPHFSRSLRPGYSAQARSAESMKQNVNIADLIEQFGTLAAQAEPWILAHLTKPESEAKIKENSPVTTTDNKFEVRADVSNFAPEEINVKVVDNSIVIEAKHEEKEDKYGFISRQFVRRFILPEVVILEKMTCKIIKDNTILISAPRIVQKLETNEKTIPITIVRQNTPIAPTPTPTFPSTSEDKSESFSDFVKI